MRLYDGCSIETLYMGRTGEFDNADFIVFICSSLARTALICSCSSTEIFRLQWYDKNHYAHEMDSSPVANHIPLGGSVRLRNSFPHIVRLLIEPVKQYTIFEIR